MVSIKINSYTCRGYLLKVSLIFPPNKQNSLYPDQLIIISHLLGYKHNFLNNNLFTHPVSSQLIPEYSISPLSCLYSRWEVTYSEARIKGQWESPGSFLIWKYWCFGGSSSFGLGKLKELMRWKRINSMLVSGQHYIY